MRKAIFVLLAVAMVAPLAVAELQNVEVGGQLRIRGNWFTNEIIGAGGWAFDDRIGNDWTFVEQRTRLNVKADFTDEVCAFIELDSYDIWGEDFRSASVPGSNWIAGSDGRAVSNNDVEMYQGYVEANNMFGQPLRLRVGRQELALGSQWLVGVNDASSIFQGLSFDGIRLTYATDMVSVDAFWAKLVERSPIEQDGDVDLYGVYGSYLGLEDITLDAYWMLVRDARSIVPVTNDPVWGPFGGNFAAWALNRLENVFNVDQWDPTYLHTVGLRGAGTVGAFDFEAEVAYQFGDADAVSSFIGSGVYAYPDDDASFDAFGANLEVGYTFDMSYSPRVFLGGAYLGGDDNRDNDRPDTFGEWLVNNVIGWPFTESDDSLSFNRLFSNWEYSEFIENSELSNCWLLRGGVSAMPTEDLEVLLTLTYMESMDATDVAAWPGLIPWRTVDLDSTLGWEAGLYVTYNYSEDLTFKGGYAHLFVDDGLTGANLWQARRGNFSALNGTANYAGPFGNFFWATVTNLLGWNVVPGKDADDADYVFVETQIKF